MSQLNQSRTSKGRIVFGVAFGLLLGLLQPFFLSLQVAMPMMLPSITVMAVAALYAATGPVSLITFLVTLILSSVSPIGYGLQLGAASLPATIVPVVVMAFGLKKKRPFFSQLKWAIISGFAGIVLSVAFVAMIFGTDMIAKMMAEVRALFEELMPALWSVQGAAFVQSGIELTYEEFSTLYFDSLKILQQYYELYLPATLLTDAALAAVIGSLWSNWLAARRGNATRESYATLADWYLPSNATVGMLLTVVTALVLRNFAIIEMEAVWNAVSSLVQLAFMVQGFAVLDRRQKERGATSGKRIGLVFLFGGLGVLTSGVGMINVFTLLTLTGAASALFGRKGAVKLWLEKKKNDMDGEDR